MKQAFKNTIQLTKYLAGVIATSIVISSCSDNNKKQKNSYSESGMQVAPAYTLIKTPITPNPDTCPPPYTIVIPAILPKKIVVVPPPPQPETLTFNNGKHLKIVPPEIKKADFFVSMKNYNTEQGLAQSSIRCGYKDKMGNLWFGTNGGGISKYDGKSFTNYTSTQGFPVNTVWCITEDKKGNMWFGTLGAGASKYDGKSFTTYTSTQGLANNYVFGIIEDKLGNMWFATDGAGVCKYDGKKFTTYNKADGLASNNVWSITQDKTGNIWFGTLGDGVSKYDGKSFTTFNKNQGLANNIVRGMMEDKKGNLWFGTNGGGVSKYDGKTFTNYTVDEGLASNYIFNIKEDKMGALWFSTDGGGVSKYDGKTFANFTTNQGLISNDAISITEDMVGNLWFGTLGAGLSEYDGESLMAFTTDQGLTNNTVFSIFEDRSGNMWFGTQGGGVTKYDGKSAPDGHSNFTNYTTAQGLANNYVTSIVQDKTGNIWFATGGGGVSEYDGETFTNHTATQGLVSNYISYAIQDKKGNFWFCSDGGGVSKYNAQAEHTGKARFTNFKTAQGLANNTVLTIAEDKQGNIWFGTDGGGISKYDGKFFTTFNKSQGLSNNHILSSIEDRKGNLWFGTDGGGVCKYDGKSFRKYNSELGLPDDVVYAIAEDTINKMLWLGTNIGLSGLKRSASSSYGEEENENIKFENFNFNTGYSIKDLNTNALFVDSKGIVWGGTGDKLIRFDYKKVNKNLNPPNVYIQSIKINNEKVCWNNLIENEKENQPKLSRLLQNKKDSSIAPQTAANKAEETELFGRLLNEAQRDVMRKKFGDIKFSGITSFYSLPENLVLPYGHNNITFEFLAIETAHPNLVLYQHMLEGYDNDWSPLTNRTTADFGNIHEGKYTFKLKAKSPDGIWSEPITYTFKVLPPTHRTWWAYGIYLIVLSGLLFILISWRTTSLQKDKEILEHTVVERTAEAVLQKEEAEKQKSISEQKNLKIIDSINYAKHIQQAILPSEEVMNHLLPDSFIFFKPKDIVSGDFYWAHFIDEHRVLIAVVDCTGHGVPGAFMSIMGYNLLEQAVKTQPTHQPSMILNDLSSSVIKSLKQTKGLEALKDGMDVALCKIDHQNNELEFAGAHNSLYHIRNGVLTETKADRSSIGISSSNVLFNNHKIKLQKADCIYIFSDGFADQKGAATQTKFFYQPFRELLIRIHRLPMNKQKEILNETFESWKGSQEQIDDVTIIGIRV